MIYFIDQSLHLFHVLSLLHLQLLLLVLSFSLVTLLLVHLLNLLLLQCPLLSLVFRVRSL